MEAEAVDPQVSSSSSPILPHTDGEAKEEALPAEVVVDAPTAAVATTAEDPQPHIQPAVVPRVASHPTPTS